MAGLNAPVGAQTNEPENARGALYGRILFAVYLLLYLGYVLTTAFFPALMERTPLGGINLSVLYGLGLIATAIFMAILYDWLCRAAGSATSEPNTSESVREDRP